MANGLFGDIRDFVEQPFSASMSAFGWFKFFGLLMVIAVMWHMVIRAYTNAST
jgi:hypothetical protein